VALHASQGAALANRRRPPRPSRKCVMRPEPGRGSMAATARSGRPCHGVAVMRVPFLAAVALAAAMAGPAAAGVVHALSGNGDYDIAYDTAQQSLPITVTDSFDRTVIHLDGSFVGDPESGDLSDGITESIFHVLLNMTFTPTAGHVFTGVDVSD